LLPLRRLREAGLPPGPLLSLAGAVQLLPAVLLLGGGGVGGNAASSRPFHVIHCWRGAALRSGPSAARASAAAAALRCDADPPPLGGIWARASAAVAVPSCDAIAPPLPLGGIWARAAGLLGASGQGCAFCCGVLARTERTEPVAWRQFWPPAPRRDGLIWRRPAGAALRVGRLKPRLPPPPPRAGRVLYLYRASLVALGVGWVCSMEVKARSRACPVVLPVCVCVI
jgi:hypothetical protein